MIINNTISRQSAINDLDAGVHVIKLLRHDSIPDHVDEIKEVLREKYADGLKDMTMSEVLEDASDISASREGFQRLQAEFHSAIAIMVYGELYPGNTFLQKKSLLPETPSRAGKEFFSYLDLDHPQHEEKKVKYIESIHKQGTFALSKVLGEIEAGLCLRKTLSPEEEQNILLLQVFTIVGTGDVRHLEYMATLIRRFVRTATDEQMSTLATLLDIDVSELSEYLASIGDQTRLRPTTGLKIREMRMVMAKEYRIELFVNVLQYIQWILEEDAEDVDTELFEMLPGILEEIEHYDEWEHLMDWYDRQYIARIRRDGGLDYAFFPTDKETQHTLDQIVKGTLQYGHEEWFFDEFQKYYGGRLFHMQMQEVEQRFHLRRHHEFKNIRPMLERMQEIV